MSETKIDTDFENMSLEEKMFYLGSNCKPLPLEPAPINREYYNKGLNIYSNVMKMRSLKGMIELGTNNSEYKDVAEQGFIKVKQIYKNICEIILNESVSSIAKSKTLDQIKSWAHTNFIIIKNDYKKTQ